MHNGKDKKVSWWTFCKIYYEKVHEGRNKKVIIEPACGVALQVGDKFYLHDLRKLRKTKSKNIKVLERYSFIPADASQQQINLYIEHLRKRELKLNTRKQ